MDNNFEEAYQESQRRAKEYNLRYSRPLPRPVVKEKRRVVKDPKAVKVGEAVVFHDPSGVAHAAIITAVWSPPMVNLVYVSSDETRTDVYGRQIERATSLSHKSQVQVHGFYWRYTEEEPNPYVAPTQK